MNWIIIKSKDRGTEYGVGTFIEQFSAELARREGIHVFILETDVTGLSYFESEKVNGITYLKVPQLKSEKVRNTQTNHIKKAKSIVRVVSSYIPKT